MFALTWMCSVVVVLVVGATDISTTNDINTNPHTQSTTDSVAIITDGVFGATDNTPYHTDISTEHSALDPEVTDLDSSTAINSGQWWQTTWYADSDSTTLEPAADVTSSEVETTPPDDITTVNASVDPVNDSIADVLEEEIEDEILYGSGEIEDIDKGSSIIINNTCAHPALEHCLCNHMAHMVQCVNLDMTGANILRYIPNDTDYMVFRGNSIKDHLPDAPLFREHNEALAHTLRLIDLADNDLQVLPGKAFIHLKKMHTLMLSDNDIYISHPDSFPPHIIHNMTGLRKIHLREAFTMSTPPAMLTVRLANVFLNQSLYQLGYLNMEMVRLQTLNLPNPHSPNRDSTLEFFCSMPRVKYLLLSHNNITRVELNIPCMQEIEVIQLANNSIETITSEDISDLQSLPFLRHINLTLNPLRCDCKLIPFYHWLQDTNLMPESDKHMMVCQYSYLGAHNGMRLLSLEPDNLECDQCTDGEITLATIINCKYIIIYVVIIATLIFLALAITLCLYRKRIRARWQQQRHKHHYARVRRTVADDGGDTPATTRGDTALLQNYPSRHTLQSSLNTLNCDDNGRASEQGSVTYERYDVV